VKPLVVGHWGTTPGQNFIYVHLNRVIKKYDLDIVYIAGPGHGGPALWEMFTSKAPWSEVYPNVTQDEAGLKKLFKQFSFPRRDFQHVAPTTPGSSTRWRAGVLAQSAFGAASTNPELIVACVIGDGRSGNGLAGDFLAVQKLSQPDYGRRRLADSCTSMLQDQSSRRVTGTYPSTRVGSIPARCGWTPYFVGR